MALHKLIFDTTSADTMNDSANVGAYLRGEDGTLLTHTTDGSREALDVYTELGQVEDSAHTTGDIGAMALAVRNDTEGSLVSADGDYAPLQVDATGRLRVVADLEVTNSHEKAEDSAHTTGDIGSYVLAVRADTRPTNANTSADGDYASLFVNTNGELYVKATDSDALLTTIDADTSSIATDASTIAGDTTSIDATLTALSKAEDAAHSSGDQGIMSLAVRNDTLASLVDTDGDYAPLQVDADGALYVNVATGSDDSLADTAILQVAETVGTTVGQIIDAGDELASRKYVMLFNNGNRDMYVGATGVTTGDGFPLPPGAILEMRLGSSVDLYAIADAAGQDLRTLQLS